jgi:hypothetical protein
MKRTGITIAAILMALALFAGCADIFSPPAADGDGPAPAPGTGRALVSVGPQGARTLMPADYSAYGGLSYTYEFTAAGKDPVSGTIPAGTGTESVDLAQGTWGLTVQGFNYGTPVIEGKVTGIEITTGQQTPVSVSMAGIPGGDNGSLGYTVNFPDTVSSAFFRVYPWNKEAFETQVDLLLSGTPNGDSTKTSTGFLPLSPGYYRVSLDLAIAGAPGGVFSKTEIAHIYPGLTTPADFTITGTDFIPATEQADLAAALGTISGLSSGDNVVYFLSSASETMAGTAAAIENSNGPVTVTIDGGGREVTLTGNGSLVVVGNNVTLAFKNITLKGSSGASLVRVESGGTLELGAGAKITGNTAYSTSDYSCGGGVYVAGNGTFTMNGGEITGNMALTDYSSSLYSFGGGVYVAGYGTFTMNGGEITGNTASSYSYSLSDGGGVYVAEYGTFTMSGGKITNNTAYASGFSQSYGGGVYVAGNFTMDGGEITENTASDSSSINSTYGGGVCVYVNGAFTMSGGKIADNTASEGGGVYVYVNGAFTMSEGEITGNISSASLSSDGGGVYAGGAFIMSGGEITGKMVSASLSDSYGGGVYVAGNGTFTMSVGVITGNTASGDSKSV